MRGENVIANNETVTLRIVQSENDYKYDVRAYDEVAGEPCVECEKCGFPTWETAQAFIDELPAEFPDIHFVRDYDGDYCAES